MDAVGRDAAQRAADQWRGEMELFLANGARVQPQRPPGVLPAPHGIGITTPQRGGVRG